MVIPINCQARMIPIEQQTFAQSHLPPQISKCFDNDDDDNDNDDDDGLKGVTLNLVHQA